MGGIFPINRAEQMRRKLHNEFQHRHTCMRPTIAFNVVSIYMKALCLCVWTNSRERMCVRVRVLLIETGFALDASTAAEETY